jgi:hypothetical protein
MVVVLFTLVRKESLDRVVMQFHHLLVVHRVSILVELFSFLAVLIVIVHHVTYRRNRNSNKKFVSKEAEKKMPGSEVAMNPDR